MKFTPDNVSYWERRVERGPYNLLTPTAWRESERGSEEVFAVCDALLTTILHRDIVSFAHSRTSGSVLTVLDVGGGFGRLSIPLATEELARGRVCLLDASSAALRLARDCAVELGVADSVELVHDSATQLDSHFADRSFSLVILGALLLHVVHDEWAESILESVAALVEPGGRVLLFETMFDDNPSLADLYGAKSGYVARDDRPTRLRDARFYIEALEPFMALCSPQYSLPWCGERVTVLWFHKRSE